MAVETIGNHKYGSGKIDKNELEKREKFIQSLWNSKSKEGEEFYKQMRCNSIFEPSDMDYRRSFYPFKRIDPYNRVQGTKEYVFFTKPHLPILSRGGNLTNQFSDIPFFQSLMERGNIYSEILEDLSGGIGSKDNSPFIKILTNRITSNIDIPSLNVDVLETAQNMWGTKIIYPKTSMSSDEGMEFTCEFEETKYLEIYTLFKAWDLYRQMKWWGIVSPPQYCIDHKILNDHIAVYKFIVGEDGETLLYWCKWTGVFPSTIGRDTFSEIPVEGPLKLTITFKVSGWFEDMEPNILSDFRQLLAQVITDSNQHNRWTIWDNTYGGVNQDNMYLPWIEFGPYDTTFRNIYFEWLEI